MSIMVLRMFLSAGIAFISLSQSLAMSMPVEQAANRLVGLANNIVDLGADFQKVHTELEDCWIALSRLDDQKSAKPGSVELSIKVRKTLGDKEEAKLKLKTEKRRLVPAYLVIVEEVAMILDPFDPRSPEYLELLRSLPAEHPRDLLLRGMNLGSYLRTILTSYVTSHSWEVSISAARLVRGARDIQRAIDQLARTHSGFEYDRRTVRVVAQR